MKSDGSLRTASFSADGRFLLFEQWGYADSKEPIQLFDTVTGLKKLGVKGTSAALDAKGERLLAGHYAGTAVWDVKTGTKALSFAGHRREIDHLALSADGSLIVSASSINREALAWDASTGEMKWDLQPKGRSDSVAFTPAGEIRIASDEGEVTTWDPRAGLSKKTIRLLDWRGGRDALVFSPKGDLLLTSELRRQPMLFDLLTGKGRALATPHKATIRCAAYLADGKIATGGEDKTAILWDVDSGEAIRRFHGHEGWILKIAATPDGKEIMTGAGDGMIILWDTASGDKKATMQQGGAVRFLRFAPNLQALSLSAEGAVRLWDLKTGKERARLYTFDEAADWLVIAADGRFDGSPGGVRRVSFRGADGLIVDAVLGDATAGLWSKLRE